MSSTFALPTTVLSTVRLPRRRRSSRIEHSARLMPVEQTPVVVATEAVADAVEMPFLRTPASWTLVPTASASYLDHVAVAPSGVLAITTRYHVAAEGDAHVQRAWQDIRTAKGAAKLLELTLGDKLGAIDDEAVTQVTVRPVLVLWGPGAPELENGYLVVKGVTVLDPARPQLWSHLFDTPALDPAALTAMIQTVRTLHANSNDMPIALVG